MRQMNVIRDLSKHWVDTIQAYAGRMFLSMQCLRRRWITRARYLLKTRKFIFSVSIRDFPKKDCWTSNRSASTNCKPRTIVFCSNILPSNYIHANHNVPTHHSMEKRISFSALTDEKEPDLTVQSNSSRPSIGHFSFSKWWMAFRLSDFSPYTSSWWRTSEGPAWSILTYTAVMVRKRR